MKDQYISSGFNQQPGGIEGFKAKYLHRSEGLSHQQATHRMDRYFERAQTPDQRLSIHRMKQHYLEQRKKTGQNRIAQNYYYTMGERARLPQASYEQLQYDRERYDQFQRDNTMKEVKTYYHDHLSLSKGFRERDKGSKNMRHKFQNRSRGLDRE